MRDLEYRDEGSFLRVPFRYPLRDYVEVVGSGFRFRFARLGFGFWVEVLKHPHSGVSEPKYYHRLDWLLVSIKPQHWGAWTWASGGFSAIFCISIAHDESHSGLSRV